MVNELCQTPNNKRSALRMAKNGKNIFIVGVFLAFMMILTISTVSALDFDNVKKYDSDNQKVKIVNAFGLGDDLGTIQLVNYSRYCFVGDCYAYYLVDNYVENYVLKSSKYYNEHQTRELKNKEYKYEYLNLKTFEWEEYKLNQKLRPGQILIREKVDVEEGETVDVVPNFYGMEITEWIDFTGLRRFEFQIDQDAFSTFGGALWRGQNITIGSAGPNENFIIAGISLFLNNISQVTTDVNISISSVDAGGLPVLDNLSTGSIPFADMIGVPTWHNVTMSATTLLASTRYAIVVHSDAAGYRWQQETAGGYGGGGLMTSSDTGVSWDNSGAPNVDFAFQIWGTGQGDIDVTLTLPANGSSDLINNEITFNATIEPLNISLLNATIFIWDDSSNIINQTTTNLSTNSSIGISQLLASNFTGTNFWNVQACGVNLSQDILCVFAEDNFTLTIDEFEVNNEGFLDDVLETDYQFFQLNISTTPTILSVEAFLNYNSSRTLATTVCSAGNCTSEVNIDIPLVGGGTNENKTFFWELNIFDGTSVASSNTTSQQQNVTAIQLGRCEVVSSTQVLNFTAFDEQNVSRIDPFVFGGDFDFWIGAGTVKQNNSIANISISEVDLCITPNETYFLDAIIEYNDENSTASSYTQRNYYFQNDTVSNNTILDVPLYLLRSASSTSFILKVQDENLLPVTDALIEIHRFYPGEGVFRIVQIAKTDDNGKSVGFFQTETVDYKFIIKKNGVVLLETGQQKVIPETSPFTLTFNTGTDLGEPWASQEGISNLNSTLTWNSDTGIVTYTYADISGNFTQARLWVQEESLTNSTAYITICNTTSIISSASITCSVGNSSGFYIASSFITRAGEGLDLQINFQIETLSSVAGVLGLFFGWFLILIASFMFKFNEVAGIWATTITIFLVNLMGLIKFGGVFVSAIIGISVILTWLMSK